MSSQNLSVNNSSAAPIAITGLASGLDTSAIVSEMMSIARAPLNHLTLQQQAVQAQQSQLQSIQTALQTLSTDMTALRSPSLWANTQQVTSSDSTRVSATSSTGAGVGGYQVSVSQLANSAQRTFSFSSPAADDQITIDGHATTIKAGSSVSDVVAAINGDPNATVYAAATDGGTLVFSNRSTGDTGANFIQVSDPGGSLVEQTGKAKEGQNAIFSVDGVNGSSASNTVTNAIAGVSLTLTGVTTTSGPVTVNVAPPAPNADNVTTAVKQFITDYNNVVNQVSSQLTQPPVFNPQTQADAGTGTLYGDQDLNNLLNNMRTMMYTAVSGLPAGMNSLSDIGISTGAPGASLTNATSTLTGNLTLDPTALQNAITSNPSGVATLLKSFSFQLQTAVDAEAQPGGVIDQRITSDTAQSSYLGNQIQNMNATLAVQQQSLQTKFANLESALSLSQSQGSELANQIAQLP